MPKNEDYQDLARQEFFFDEKRSIFALPLDIHSFFQYQ